MRAPDDQAEHQVCGLQQAVAANDVMATVRGYDDIVDAFRTAKARLGLSNRVCDELCGFVEGHTDKYLGPTGSRGLTRMAISRFCTVFAIKFEMKIDEVQAGRMQGRWEARDSSNVRLGGPRLGSAVLERAKPLVLKDLARLGVKARMIQLTAEQRSAIARKAGRARQRKRRKDMRERVKERRLSKSAAAAD